MAETLQIRLSEKEQARFKALADELGLKHGEALNVMMNALEGERAAAVVPDMAKGITDFNSYLSQLQRLYTQAAQAVGEQRDLAREAVRRETESKDATIRDLQTRLAAAEEKAQQAAELRAELERTRTELTEARKTIDLLNALRKDLPDQEEHDQLKRRVIELEARNEELARIVQQALGKRDEAGAAAVEP